MINKTIASFFVFFCLFPWLSFGILDLDLQPYFLILALIVVFMNFRVKVVREIWLLFVLMICSIVIGLEKIDSLMVRGVVGYSSLFLLVFAIFVIKKKQLFDTRPYLYIANYIWLFCGTVQTLIHPNILDFLVSVRTTARRGVTGLAPEPTFFAVFLVFLTLLILKENNYNLKINNVKRLLCANIFFTIFVAKSSMGLLFIVLIIFIYIFFNNSMSYKGKGYVLLSLVSSLYFCVNASELLPGTRIADISEKIKQGPQYVLLHDASINSRASHVVFSLQGAYESFFYPHGYHVFENSFSELKHRYAGFFWWGDNPTKIMSGFGGIVFELGWFSIFLFAFTFFCLFSKQNRSRGYSLAEFFSTSLLMFSAIPISFPLYSWFLATSYFINAQPSSERKIISIKSSESLRLI